MAAKYIAEIKSPPPPGDEVTSVWTAVTSQLRTEMEAAHFRSWIAPIVPSCPRRGVLELQVPTRFIRDWVQSRYAERIRRIAARTDAGIHRIDIVVVEGLTPVQKPADILPSLPVANDTAEVEDLSSPLDLRFTFDSFIAGPANSLAVAAAQKLSAPVPCSFNPLFIHGGVGMGKTHLAQAAAAALRAEDPAAKIVYMSAERFMYHFVRSLRRRDTIAFKSFFQDVDALMIDDVQFICGKQATQDEFFHMFNTLLGRGVKMILTADRSPAYFQDMESRLMSRLGGGLVVKINPADTALRFKILQSKCRFLRREIPKDVLMFLAEKVATNIRELEGALNRLIAHAEVTSLPLTSETARVLLQDIIAAAPRRLCIEDIQKAVAAHYHIPVSDILSKRRHRAIARPRQVAMYLSKVMTLCSLPEIGRRFAGRDHTTIIHGIRRVESLMTSDAQIARDIEALKRQLTL